MISPCTQHKLTTYRDERGALAFVESGDQMPFVVQRVFHLFDLRTGVARGGHAHKKCHEFLIAMSGTFRVTTDDGTIRTEWTLVSPNQGLHIPPGYWIELVPQNDSAVLSVLASHPYDETDYIRERSEFIQTKE